MTERINTVVIGAGQAGLAVSYYLSQENHEHIVLEKQAIGDTWRKGRWDSFTLVSPNWTLKLPGFEYTGAEPNAYLSRDDVVQYLEDYARQFNPPIRTGVTVTCVKRAGDGFQLETDQSMFEAANVVIATGAFQNPKIPPYSSKISREIVQFHSSQYRNPQQLPDGAVLVAGSGQSGCQIAEELYQAGRKVYLATGRAGRLPRKYRGKDVFDWTETLGMFDKTVDKLESPEERFAANPQATGKADGRSLNLHQFALDGVTLLGRLQDAEAFSIKLAPDLMENLACADELEANFKQAVDIYIEENGLHIPQDPSPELRAGYASEIITRLDLAAAGITSIIWAMGYSFDFSWLQFPIFDAFGYPEQERGVSKQAGLYFIGLQWLHKSKSSLLYGVGEDAAYITRHILNRN